MLELQLVFGCVRSFSFDCLPLLLPPLLHTVWLLSSNFNVDYPSLLANTSQHYKYRTWAKEASETGTCLLNIL
jgi:hypothetical protein